MVNRLRTMDGRLFWVLAASGVLLALALILGANIQKTNAETSSSTLRTGQVVRGDIEEMVKASGQVTARGLDLPFSASGVISDVLVKPGSVVQAGQVIAKLDSRDAESSLAQAIASQKTAQARLDSIQNGPTRELATAQQNLKIAQARLDQIKAGNTTDEDKAAVQAAIDAAVYRYNALVSKPNQREVASAEASLRKAKADYNNIKAGPLQSQLDQVNAKIAQAQQNLDKVKSQTAGAVSQADLALQKATKNRDSTKDTYDQLHKQNYNDDGTVKKTTTQADLDREKQAKVAAEQADLDVQAAQKALDTAKSQQISAVKEAEAVMIEAQAVLEKLQAGASEQSLLSAQAAVDKAQADYERAVQAPSQDEINAAQADINKARSTLSRLEKGGSDKDIAVAQAELDKYQQQVQDLSKGANSSDVGQAQGELERAAAQVTQAQLKIEASKLLAPFNSVVESVYVTPGQTISPGPAAFTLVDLSGLTVEARVNQSSIESIKTGLPMRIYFQGISGVREEPFGGKVTFVSFQAKGNPAQPATNPARLSPAASTDAAMPGLEAGYPVSIVLDRDGQIRTLKPGMIGQVVFVLARKTDVLLVPKIAVREIATGNVVDVMLPGGQLVATPVKAGLVNDTYVELSSNTLLREGDKIVLYGNTEVPALPTPTTGPSSTPNGSLSPVVSLSPETSPGPVNRTLDTGGAGSPTAPVSLPVSPTPASLPVTTPSGIDLPVSQAPVIVITASPPTPAITPTSTR